jgi:3-hydroxyacyl-[acyl-carrier-protein] dehydratase
VSVTSRWTGLDGVVSVDPAKSAEGFRNVPNTLAIFDSHFPRFHVLPGVLILGSMGTLAAHLLEEETGKKWRLAGAGQVGYRHFVQPGDRMDISVTLKEHGEDSAVLSGEVKVDGKLVTRARQLRMEPQ